MFCFVLFCFVLFGNARRGKGSKKASTHTSMLSRLVYVRLPAFGHPGIYRESKIDYQAAAAAAAVLCLAGKERKGKENEGSKQEDKWEIS
jgi:hypothetical protein